MFDALRLFVAVWTLPTRLRARLAAYIDRMSYRPSRAAYDVRDRGHIPADPLALLAFADGCRALDRARTEKIAADVERCLGADRAGLVAELLTAEHAVEHAGAVVPGDCELWRLRVQLRAGVVGAAEAEAWADRMRAWARDTATPPAPREVDDAR